MSHSPFVGFWMCVGVPPLLLEIPARTGRVLNSFVLWSSLTVGCWLVEPYGQLLDTEAGLPVGLVK